MENCKYCKKIKPSTLTNKNNLEELSIKIEGTVLKIHYEAFWDVRDEFHDEIEINYCPMCGRKLN